jgi:hypothetical protein
MKPSSGSPGCVIVSENPRLMREFGLIIETLDGFDDLANKFTLQGVPNSFGLPDTIDSAQGSRTGWSGDGSPGDGTLFLLRCSLLC